MANNKIQIKRSTTNATVTGLANGELAFTGNGSLLYIGSPNGNGASIPIGGELKFGNLTPSLPLVANSTSGIDKVIVGNLVPTAVYANGTFGTDGQLLTSNGTTVYWSTPPASVAGANTQIQFNDSGTLAGSANLTFDKTTGKLTVGNSTVNTTITPSKITANSAAITDTTTSSNTTTGALTVAGGLGVNGRINVTDLAAGNTSEYSTVNGSTVSTKNVFATDTVNAATLSVGGWVIANTSGVYASGKVNGSIVGVGSQFFANTTAVVLSQGMVLYANGALGSANQVLRSDGSGTAYWSTDNGDISGVAAGSGLSGGGTSGDVTLSVNANNGIVANSTGVFVNAGNTLTVNSTGLFVNNTLSITSLTTSGNVVVNGNTTLGSDTSDLITINAPLSGNLMPSANVTYNVGNNTMRWNEIHASNVHSITGYFDGNVEISGDLIVTGNVTTVNVSSIVVSDPMIYLAGNNYTSDLVDIGFAANYYDGATQRHTGFFRDATDGIYKLFSNSTQELSGNNTVNTAAVGYTTATLIAYLSSGGLSTNSTSANLIANSTYAVGIVANNLTLTTALAGTSGGTGKTTVTSQALLVGNTTNGYNELTLGTSGYVLQSNGSAVVYDVLDGGTF